MGQLLQPGRDYQAAFFGLKTVPGYFAGMIFDCCRPEDQAHGRAFFRRQNVYVLGHGSNARIWFLIAVAGLDQSINPSVFFSLGAFEAKAGSWARASKYPAFNGSCPQYQPGPQFREPLFQFYRGFIGADVGLGLGDARPGSTLGVMWMTVTPVLVSPL